MPSKIRSTLSRSSPAGAFPGPSLHRDGGDSEPSAEATNRPVRGGETRVAYVRRIAHRVRLHGYAIGLTALVAYLIALAVSNTGHVRADWVFGSSHVSLVWLVLFTAILGWLLGLATSGTFHWRTRTPRGSRRANS